MFENNITKEHPIRGIRENRLGDKVSSLNKKIDTIIKNKPNKENIFSKYIKFLKICNNLIKLLLIPQYLFGIF